MNEAPACLRSAAAAYAARQPYLLPFFKKLADDLSLDSRSTRMLDLAAGPGPLALGFSPYVASCLMIDGDPEMLAMAQRQPFAPCCRTEFLRCRAEELPQDRGPFDFVTIGRALHWLDPALSLEVLSAVTHAGSCVAVCWAGSGGVGQNPWLTAFRTVINRYRSGPPSRLGESSESFFHGSDFAFLSHNTMAAKLDVSLDTLVARGFSYSTTSPQILGTRAAKMEAELRSCLSPYAVDGVISETVTNSVQIFRRT